MTVPGGDSGENAQDGTDQPPFEEAAGQPEQGTSSPSTGFEVHPGLSPRYQPPGYPPPGYQPPGYPSPPGFDVPHGAPPGPAPGYPPPGPPADHPSSGYGAPYPAGYDRPQPKTNSLAIASLVVSIIGLIPYFGGVLSIVGIVLGAVAINQVKKTGEAGYGLAVAGIAVGAITLVIGLIITISVMPYRS